MESILVAEKIVGMKSVTYEMVFSGKAIGIAVETKGERVEEFLPDTAENILRLIRNMAACGVTPITVLDVLEDVYCTG